jgi:hypothetical protein
MNTEQENGKDIYEGDIIINHIGMVAGFATAEQLRRAAQKALERADRIDKLKTNV